MSVSPPSGDDRMSPPDPGMHQGISGSARRFGAAVAALAATRVELAAVEFAEFRQQSLQSLVMAIAAGLLLGFALLVATFLVIVLFWDTHRITSIVAVLIVYLAGGVLLALQAKHRAAKMSKPFAATLDEFRRDADALRGRRGVQP